MRSSSGSTFHISAFDEMCFFAARSTHPQTVSSFGMASGSVIPPLERPLAQTKGSVRSLTVPVEGTPRVGRAAIMVQPRKLKSEQRCR